MAKYLLAMVMVALLAVMPVVASAGMLEVGADQWDVRYQKAGTLAGKYGERQIDKDGLDCTPLDVKLAVVGAYVALMGGIFVPPIGMGGGHYVEIDANTFTTTSGRPPVTTSHHTGQFVKSGGAAAFPLAPFVSIGGFLAGMATAMYLSDSEAHAKCMQAKGYNISGGFVNTEHVGVRGVPLNQYSSGFGGANR
jgi:hypothetical protein